jgi:hypothetical protein
MGMRNVSVLTLVSRRWYGFGCLALLVLTVAACFSWRPYDAGSGLLAGEPLPNRLRVTRQDSTRVALTKPFLHSDTLFGRRQRDTIAVPLADIAFLERERFSITRTLGAVVGVPAAALGLTFLVVCGEGQCQPDY